MWEREKSKDKGKFSNAVGKGFSLRRASLTVEAAMVVPLFIFCMVALICMADIYGSYAKQTVKLQELVEETGVASAAIAGENDQTDYIDLLVPVNYSVRGIHIPGILIACRGRVYPWTGRNPEEDTSIYDGDEGDSIVYLTDNASVYHTSTECTNLHLDIRSVSSYSVGLYRNADGNKYKACEKCIGNGNAASTVYIGREGDCYHNSATCSGLTRHIHIVKASEVENLHQCSKCAQLESQGTEN